MSAPSAVPDVTAAPTGNLPKTGGDPLTLTAAGTFLLGAGYSVRRRLNLKKK
jgi:LPXTG-motif cell wall-anchored protein